ncbi:hypothetical protein M9980_08480 [Sphingomonas donggukensis]|uniref:Uncharacterized protein n=1 Tax=Sphingomonas donggukensis TaxID=2949093 RepID=A0ABY4TQG7_9SPHN|nr:hypothetical protein [Sphingomonas donggukensis]URW74612.1 hypothetical protein M9980_08480 [Sphingomonas donggukensis]
MTPANAWRWCAAAGVAAFLCSWGFGQIPGLVACGPTGGLGPIIAFEFVRSPAHVAMLFGAEPCRSALVAAQKTGLLLDALGFIPAYAAFLVFAALACSPAKAGVQSRAAHSSAPAFAGERIRWLVIGAILLAALCDQIEGALLYRILADLPGPPTLIDALWWPVHIKFALLAAGTAGIAILLLSHMRLPGFVAALFVTIGVCTAVAGWLNGPSPVMMLGFTISWVTILLSALLASWRPSLFSARAAPPPVPAPPSA